MASNRVQFLRYGKQKKCCKDCFHDCVCPHLRDDDAEKCGAYITDVAPVVHARWIKLGDADYQCSSCGFRFTSGDDISEFKHCRCGAKMDRTQ